MWPWSEASACDIAHFLFLGWCHATIKSCQKKGEGKIKPPKVTPPKDSALLFLQEPERGCTTEVHPNGGTGLNSLRGCTSPYPHPSLIPESHMASQGVHFDTSPLGCEKKSTGKGRQGCQSVKNGQLPLDATKAAIWTGGLASVQVIPQFLYRSLCLLLHLRRGYQNKCPTPDNAPCETVGITAGYGSKSTPK